MARKNKTTNWKTLKGELWKAVPESEDLFISNMGRVRNQEGVLFVANGRKDTYRSLSIKIKGVRKAVKIHRLVLTLFNRPPQPKEFARHTNGDISDNRLENLAWCSLVETSRVQILNNPVDAKLSSRFGGRTGTMRQPRDIKTP